MRRKTHGGGIAVTPDTSSMRRRALMRREARLGFLMLCAVAAALALNPGVAGIPPTLFGWDKFEHAAGFAALAALLRYGWPAQGWRLQAAALAAYGAAIEFVQALPVIGRSPSPADWIADLIGIAIGLLLGEAAVRIEKRLPGRT